MLFICRRVPSQDQHPQFLLVLQLYKKVSKYSYTCIQCNLPQFMYTLFVLIFARLNFSDFRDLKKITKTKTIFWQNFKPLSPFFSEIAKIKPRKIRIVDFAKLSTREIKYEYGSTVLTYPPMLLDRTLLYSTCIWYIWLWSYFYSFAF